MKKYFVAYKYSEEAPEILHERMTLVVDALSRAGIEAYCNLFDQHEYDAGNLNARQIMDKAFKKIDESDGLFVLIVSNDKSEGQLMEVGYALKAAKPIIVAVQADVKSYVPDMASQSIMWTDTADLTKQLEGIKS